MLAKNAFLMAFIIFECFRKNPAKSVVNVFKTKSEIFFALKY